MIKYGFYHLPARTVGFNGVTVDHTGTIDDDLDGVCGAKNPRPVSALVYVKQLI